MQFEYHALDSGWPSDWVRPQVVFEWIAIHGHADPVVQTELEEQALVECQTKSKLCKAALEEFRWGLRQLGIRAGRPIKFAWLELLPCPPSDPKTLICATLILLLFWSGMSLLAFSFAGERMPWLTTHITMPMILTAGWALGYLIEKIDWQEVREKNGWLVLLLSIVFFVAFGSLLGSLLGTQPPFQGKELLQLQATSNFLLALIGTIGAGAGLFALLRNWGGANFWRSALLVFMGLLSLQTARTAYRAAYINYDNAKELLVYAHSTRDMKDTVEQIETISRRLYGDKTIKIAYDNDVRYPYWWYMRDYPNKIDFDQNVTKTLQDSPIIVVGASNFSKIEPVVRDNYYRFDYKRMWWPNEALYRDWTLSSVLRDWMDAPSAPQSGSSGLTATTRSMLSPSATSRRHVQLAQDLARMFIKKTSPR